MIESNGESLPTETPRGLPIVSQDTYEALRATYPGTKWGDYISEVQARLLDENPYLVQIMEGQASQYPKEMHLPIFKAIVSTVAAIEHQAQANKLRRELGLG